MTNQLKQSFLLNEIWMLSINAAFQRAKVYNESSLKSEKNLFKSELKDFIANLALDYKSTVVEDVNHLKNIRSVISFSEKYNGILKGESLNFGVSQKLLNLYLKYLWCLNIITIHPPHFPVDRIIQKKLKLKPISWTQMTNADQYMRIIQVAREQLADSKFALIAELELHLFKRREIVKQTTNYKQVQRNPAN